MKRRQRQAQHAWQRRGHSPAVKMCLRALNTARCDIRTAALTAGSLQRRWNVGNPWVQDLCFILSQTLRDNKALSNTIQGINKNASPDLQGYKNHTFKSETAFSWLLAKPSTDKDGKQVELNTGLVGVYTDTSNVENCLRVLFSRQVEILGPSDSRTDVSTRALSITVIVWQTQTVHHQWNGKL